MQALLLDIKVIRKVINIKISLNANTDLDKTR